MPVAEQSLPGRALLRESAYVSLRDAIVNGTLAGGEQLRDNGLGAWLNVSRTRSGKRSPGWNGQAWCRRNPGCSTVVAPLDSRATREAHTAVSAMHELAVREAVPRLAAGECEQLRRANAAFASALDGNDADATRANWQTLLDAAKETHVHAG